MRSHLNMSGMSIVLAAILAFASPVLAHAAQITDARVWADASHTRLVLVASGPMDYQLSQADGRLTLDLGSSRLVDGFAVPAAQGLYRGMASVRSAQRLQLTATIAPSSSVKSFVLKPTGPDGDYRLVIDLYPDAAGKAAAPAVAKADPPDTLDPAHPRSHMVASQQAAAMLGGQRKVVVAIDAGHGGKDTGAIGPDGAREKNITLAVARDLAAQINRQPGMQAILTRTGDYFIPLKRRYEIARDDSADLFVSIHADSFTSSDAKGSSVWVLSPRGKTNAAARWLADGQNRADLIGGVSLDDKDDSLAKVLLDLQQGYAMQASDAVAAKVLKALAQLGPTHRGYVERANFVVLRSPDVPSILVETAFISNPLEERKLRDPKHQQALAAAVMEGVKDYFEATPPPGTWFAAQAAAADGARVARTTSPAGGNATAHPAANLVPERHRVGRGESLGSIARQYGVSVGTLRSANQLRGDVLRAGTVLTIPAS
jgi:N-acetylmuramoyl-L-alanine amidase